MREERTIIFKSVLISSAVTLVLLFILGASFLNNQERFLIVRESPGLPNTSLPAALVTTVEESQIISIVGGANPAVVSIIISKDVPVLERLYDGGSPILDFFFPNREEEAQQIEIGGGSGFLVSPDGLLVTNSHVVSDKDASYTVFTNEGKKYEVTIEDIDPYLDIAILRLVSDETFPYLAFGNSENLRLGQTVISIGNALGEFRNSVSVGVVSGLSRTIVADDFFGRSEFLEEVIQTDAAINLGNSGGPLLDLRGNVIGVNVAVAAGSENIGFALPSNVVSEAVNNFKKNGEIVRPYLGVRYVSVSDLSRSTLSIDYGILVQGEDSTEPGVIPGSPAEQAGIVANDVILEVDGEKIEDDRNFISIIKQKSVGQKIKLKIFREGKERIMEVVLGKSPREDQ